MALYSLAYNKGEHLLTVHPEHLSIGHLGNECRCWSTSKIAHYRVISYICHKLLTSEGYAS